MNAANKNFRNIHPKNKVAGSSVTGADGAGLPRRDGVSKTISTPFHGFSRPLFVITGVALCMGLASCVVPYDSHEGGSVSVTRYSPGYRVNTLPGGYRSENISGSTYYYHDGYYYRPGSGGYVVVDAPRSSRYYDDYNRRHQSYQTSRVYQESPNRHDGRYDRGEVITRLPDGYRVVNHRGATYYQAGDRYYRRDGETYVITTRPY